MSGAVCMATYGHDRHRRALADLCARHWDAGGLEVFTGAAFEQRSASLNVAVERAFADGHDRVLIVDADCTVSHRQARKALELCEHGAAVIAFSEFVKIRKRPTLAVLDGRTASRAQLRRKASISKFHPSSAVAVHRDLWREVGGFDQRFPAWGPSDRLFLMACDTLGEPHQRIPGPCWHWWHPRAEGRRIDGDPELVELARRYRRAAGWPDSEWPIQPGWKGWPNEGPESIRGTADPDEMRAILAEPGAPRDSCPGGWLEVALSAWRQPA